MILGLFGPDDSAYIIAEIKVPRLNAEGTFYFEVDTGADGTALHLRDAIQLLSTKAMRRGGAEGWGRIRKRFRLLCNPSSIGGVGGEATYFSEPAQIIFTHTDGAKQGFLFDLDIAKPANRGGNRFKQQLELPSLLGMNILSQFRVVMDYSKKQIFLDHS